MKIKIEDKEIEIKNTMRAYMIYEQLTNKAFNPTTLTEIIIYLYSLILANQPNINLTFEELIDYLDEHENIMTEFNEWIVSQNKINNQFIDVKKKKVKK